jgi:hypothetical protein
MMGAAHYARPNETGSGESHLQSSRPGNAARALRNEQAAALELHAHQDTVEMRIAKTYIAVIERFQYHCEYKVDLWRGKSLLRSAHEEFLCL